MTKEDFAKLENPPEDWHRTSEIKPCEGAPWDDNPCGKTTEFMYPIYGKFVCEEHRGKMMGMPLCCSHCFEPYWPHYPDRAEMCGEKWTGHCMGGGCCHERDYEKQRGLEATPEYQKQKAEEKEKRRQYNLEHADEIRDEYVTGHVDFSEEGGYAGHNVIYGCGHGCSCAGGKRYAHTANDGNGLLCPMSMSEIVKKFLGKPIHQWSKVYKLVEVPRDEIAKKVEQKN